MLAPDRIVMSPGGGKSPGSIALANCVKVNSVLAWRQIVELQPHVNDHVRVLKQLSSPARVAVRRGDCRVCNGDLVGTAWHMRAGRNRGDRGGEWPAG